MKKVVKDLDRHISEQLLEEYLLAHIEPEPETLQRLSRDAHIRLKHPRMISGHLQGRLLKMLVALVRPRGVLEIGTYTAYATVCLAESLLPTARITTVEINDELEDYIRQALALAGCAEKVDLKIGDALDVIPLLDLSCTDMVYLDADKRLYIEYFKLIQDKLPPGALVLADNTLWNGKVVDPNANDPQTKGVRTFNDYIATLKGWQQVILPIRDGLTLIRKA